jgi:hypothetical protein
MAVAFLRTMSRQLSGIAVPLSRALPERSTISAASTREAKAFARTMPRRWSGELGNTIALVSSFAIPLRRFGKVLPYVLTLGQATSEVELGDREPLICGKTRVRFLIFRFGSKADVY